MPPVTVRSALAVLAAALSATLAATHAKGAPSPHPPCAMSESDRQWLDRSLAAWDHMATKRLALAPYAPPTIVFFDQACRFERSGAAAGWTANRHDGRVAIPGGKTVPAAVTSFARQEAGNTFFVMALPSIWIAAKVFKAPDDELSAIFLHEYSHAVHFAALGPEFDRARQEFDPGDDLTDDTIQERWSKMPAYARSIGKERDLLFAAAADRDPARARRFARQAHTLIVARQARYFTGTDRGWKAYDDLFLTMEGVGQWTAFAWLSDAAGGRLSREAARDMMRGSRQWWSQDQGLALFMAIDRLFPQWPTCAFRTPPLLGVDLLAVAAKPHPKACAPEPPQSR